jgi:hypothetical protein
MHALWVLLAAAPFYSQQAMSGRIPVRAHASVSAEGLTSARDHLDTVLRNAPRLRRNLETQGYELHVLGLRQFPSDLPEYAGRRGTKAGNGERFDWHMIGGHLSEDSGRYSSCSEGTLLPIVGFRLYGDETCFHELAHAIDWFALSPEARARVVQAFRASIAAGHWKGAYAATNEHEWLAEISKYYFRRDRPDLAFYDPSLARGHDWLSAEDPDAFAFADALYNDRFDPGTPRTVTLKLAGEDGLRSREALVPIRVVVRNETDAPLDVQWIDYDGKRAKNVNVAPAHGETAVFTWRSHPFAVGALGAFVAPDNDALVVVSSK